MSFVSIKKWRFQFILSILLNYYTGPGSHFSMIIRPNSRRSVHKLYIYYKAMSFAKFCTMNSWMQFLMAIFCMSQLMDVIKSMQTKFTNAMSYIWTYSIRRILLKKLLPCSTSYIKFIENVFYLKYVKFWTPISQAIVDLTVFPRFKTFNEFPHMRM